MSEPRVFWIEFGEECDPFVMNSKPLFPSSATAFIEKSAYDAMKARAEAAEAALLAADKIVYAERTKLAALEAERDEVKELYRGKNDQIIRFSFTIDDLRERLKVAVEALEFYADVKNWTGDDGEQVEIRDEDCYRNTNMNDDLFGGLTALRALKKLEGEK